MQTNEENTRKTFRDKWVNNPQLAFSETLDENHEIHKWILSRNGFFDVSHLKLFLHDRDRILDAGCGNGRVAALLRECSDSSRTQVVAIDLVASEEAAHNLKGYKNLEVFPGNLLENLSHLGAFDFIYCQEVLHHTGNPRKAFLNLTSLLNPGGEIAIYVYKLKAPVREFTDDFIRSKIKDLPYEQAMVICDQITAFAKALSDQKIVLKVPGVDVLEIPEGEYSIQRLVYHFFMKCFWNDQLSFHDNSAINFDWYHPALCSRHTLPEVETWFADAGLKIVHRFVDFYGITVRGIKV